MDNVALWRILTMWQCGQCGTVDNMDNVTLWTVRSQGGAHLRNMRRAIRNVPSLFPHSPTPPSNLHP